MLNPEKKVVLKLDLHDDKAKQKAMKAVSTVSGIDSIAMDMKEKKMTVIGVADPVDLVGKLRKFWRTEIVSIGPAKEPKPAEEPKKEEPPKKEEAPKPAEEKKEDAQPAKKDEAKPAEEKKEEAPAPAPADEKKEPAKKDEEAPAKKEEPRRDPNEQLQELIKNIPRPPSAYYHPHYMAQQAYYPYATPPATQYYYNYPYAAAHPAAAAAAQYPYISQPQTQTRYYAPQAVEEDPSSCTIL